MKLNYFFCCVYSASKPSRYRNRPQVFFDLIDLLTAKCKKLGRETIFIVGDMNFKNTNWKQMRSTDYSEALVVGKFFENSFQQVITTKSKLLNVILIKATDSVLNVSVDDRVRTFYKFNQLPYRTRFSQDKAGAEQNSNRRSPKKKRFHSLLLHTIWLGLFIQTYLRESFHPILPQRCWYDGFALVWMAIQVFSVSHPNEDKT